MRQHFVPVAMLTMALIGLALVTQPAFPHERTSTTSNASDLKTRIGELWEGRIFPDAQLHR